MVQVQADLGAQFGMSREQHRSLVRQRRIPSMTSAAETRPAVHRSHRACGRWNRSCRIPGSHRQAGAQVPMTIGACPIRANVAPDLEYGRERKAQHPLRGLTKTGEPRSDGKDYVNCPNGQYLRRDNGEQNQSGRAHKWVPKGKWK